MTAATAVKEFFASLMLRELFKGLALTGRHLFERKITVLFPEEKTPAIAALSRTARAAALPQR